MLLAIAKEEDAKSFLKINCLKKLHELAMRVEASYNPEANFNELIKKEKQDSPKYGGRTVFDKFDNKNNLL